MVTAILRASQDPNHRHYEAMKAILEIWLDDNTWHPMALKKFKSTCEKQLEEKLEYDSELAAAWTRQNLKEQIVNLISYYRHFWKYLSCFTTMI